MSKGLAPPSQAGPGQPIAEARGSVMDLISDDAKALILGELADMRAAAQRSKNTMLEIALGSAIRRVARGIYRYELRRVDPSAPTVDFDIETGAGAL